MSKLAFMADVHIGNPATFGGPIFCGVNNRGKQVLDAFEKAVIATKDFDALVICGDLFDTSNPSPQLIAKVQSILAQGPRTLILMGNHDMVSDSPGDHALGPLDVMDSIMLADRPMFDDVGDSILISIPFQTGDCREWFPKAVAQQVKKIDSAEWRIKVLAFHLGVIDSTTPEFLAHAHDAIPLETLQDLMKEHGIAHAFCGNWHNGKQWKNIVQCGALAPTGWDNPGWDYGLVRTLDTKTGLISSISIPGPRFLTAATLQDAEVAKVEAARRKCSLYLSLKGEAVDELERVREWGVQAKAVADTSAAREATRTAARAVKEASTLEEALARYVKEMPLEDKLDRQKILQLAQKYIAAGNDA